MATSAVGTVDVMTVVTYIALLHEGDPTSAAGVPVLCPLRPDGTPKPTIDHHGVFYHLVDAQTGPGVYDYRRGIDPA